MTPAIRNMLIVGGILVAVLLGFRSCLSGGGDDRITRDQSIRP